MSKILIALYMGLLPNFSRRGQGPNDVIEDPRRGTTGTSKQPVDYVGDHPNRGGFTDQKCQTGIFIGWFVAVATYPQAIKPDTT